MAQAMETATASVARRPAAAPAEFGEPIMLCDSLRAEAGWSDAQFGRAGPNPPYLRLGGKLRVTLTEYEPCFSSVRRDRGLFRSKVSIAAHLDKYDQLMVDPIAFEGITLWERRAGHVTLPLEPLAVASAIWLRKAEGPPGFTPAS